ncbi:hypothetical protein [Roseobacter litoralis]|uniref:Uncharacterized protein n=1 Tax=Roseobacter litoralis (strain ATCC 49566 / DSM 6996 / JCM 21268 / NBRC 15278 / OCh 149) TaxID=391595 RepID=F7ZBR3_ROSLO|nr:hypothetical protein [Roseobacter litoralis]AEI93105.1 hypothetical protein RLO149_c010980 [Roseobacter litoralis Och 149]
MSPLQESVDFISFEVYLSFQPKLDCNDIAVQVLGDYLANLAYEGVLCRGLEPFEGFDLAKAAVGKDAYPLQVRLVRSASFIKKFTQACAQLEKINGPALNGHAPTAFAASRIAQKSEKSLSRIFINGGLNFLELNDIIYAKQGRGGDLNDHPRQYEADMVDSKKPIIGGSTGVLKAALSEAELGILKSELADLKRDFSSGTVPVVTNDEALKIFEADLR